MPSGALLMYAASEFSADSLYFSKFQAPDPFIALQVRNQKVGLFSALEITRARKEAELDSVLSLDEWAGKAKNALGSASVAAIVTTLAKHYKVSSFTVAYDFPAGLALELKRLGLNIKTTQGTLFPERIQKSESEAKAIREGNAASAAGIAEAQRVLSEAKIRGKNLIYKGKSLTSEILRTAINKAVLEKGGLAQGTIVAGGDQGCDPHCSGYGKLRPHELIIVDVFPKIEKTGYHGDMTRTFLKGTPTPEQVKLVKTVQKAQKNALSLLKSGVKGAKVHTAVEKYFREHGYETGQKDGNYYGFFHGTGHGLGLEVHEAPRVSRLGPALEEGMVVTVEPGLYYPGIGGCRIEDVALITKNGHTLLSKAPYKWMID